MLAWVCFRAPGSYGARLVACLVSAHTVSRSLLLLPLPPEDVLITSLHSICKCVLHSVLRIRFTEAVSSSKGHFTQRALFRTRVSHVPCILFLVDWLASKLRGATSLHPPPPLPITATTLSVKSLLGTRTLVFMLAQQELSTKSHLSSPPFTF